MATETTIHQLNAADQQSILKIANWYNDEWNTPLEKTIHRLSNQPNKDVLFQLILSNNNQVVATGGLCYQVNLLNVHPAYGKLGPWVALLYTDKEHRNQGHGKRLLEQIEQHARDCGLDKIYLYTFTAVALYKRSGWITIATVNYKEHDTVVMEKTIN